jgi:hypothetical protein
MKRRPARAKDLKFGSFYSVFGWSACHVIG